MTKATKIVLIGGGLIGVTDGALAGGLAWGTLGIFSGALMGLVSGTEAAFMSWSIRKRHPSSRKARVAAVLAELFYAAGLAFMASVAPPVRVLGSLLPLLVLFSVLFGIFASATGVGLLLAFSIVHRLLRHAGARRRPFLAWMGAFNGAALGAGVGIIVGQIPECQTWRESVMVWSEFAFAGAVSLGISGAMLNPWLRPLLDRRRTAGRTGSTSAGPSG